MPSLRLHELAWEADGLRYRLHLTVRSGEVAIVTADAPVGTALADVILGLASPCAGAVHRDGADVTGYPAGSRGIALVPAGGGLLPHLTVEGNIAYAGDRAHVGDRIRELRLEGIRRLRPHQLSGIERMQVAVARALCHRPEPVAIVYEDRAGQAPFRAAVKTARVHGAAVLVITDRGDEFDGVVRPEVLGPVRPEKPRGRSSSSSSPRPARCSRRSTWSASTGGGGTATCRRTPRPRSPCCCSCSSRSSRWAGCGG